MMQFHITRKILKFDFYYFLVFLFCIGLAWLFVGVDVLNFTNISFLENGDPSQHYLGWAFFRKTSILQFPLGANNLYGIRNSIVYTDSIPIFAILFRFLNVVLPEQFQYTGLWIYISFILLGVFSFKLARLFSLNKTACLFFSMIIVLSPAFLWRLYGHYALASHWLVVSMIYLYFQLNNVSLRSLVFWILLTIIVVGVHAYFVPILLIVVFSWLIKQVFVLKNIRVFTAIFIALVYLSLILIFAWAYGYFTITSEVSRTDFGYGALPLSMIAPINPEGIWSKLLPSYPNGLDVGSNYLGSGVILGLIIFVPIVLSKGQAYIRAVNVPIIISGIILFLFSITNHVMVTNEIGYQLFSIPEPIYKFFSIFRASDRFFWLQYYLIVLSLFIFVVRSISNRFIQSSMLFFLVTIQFVDMSIARNSIKAKYDNPAIVKSVNKQCFFDKNFVKEFKSAKSIVVIPDENGGVCWKEISFLALSENSETNYGYFARVDGLAIKDSNSTNVDSLINNSFDLSAIYLINKNKQKGLINYIAHSQYGESLGDFNEHFVFLDTKTKNSFINNNYKHSMLMRTPLNCNTSGDCENFLLDGWSVSEVDGTWSDKNSSYIYLPITEFNDGPVSLNLSLLAYSFLNQHDYILDVYIGSKKIQTVKLNLGGFYQYTIRLTETDMQALKRNKYVIKFKYNWLNNLDSPTAIGLKKSDRLLGVKIKDLSLN